MKCEDCSLEIILRICCGEFPPTGDKAAFPHLDGKDRRACLYLTPQGRCSIYHQRPKICREFHCDKLKGTAVYDDMMEQMKENV